jgi:N-acetylglucosaminyldiphosphoundecaprenol N-acetyl-beta-D-mannosaminyltransferase
MTPGEWVPDPSAFLPSRDVCPMVPNAVQTPIFPTAMESLVAILGVPFHQISLTGAVDRIESMVADGGTHYVVTPNVDFLVKARRDPELRRILVCADLVLCDGKPIVWASHWLGGSLPCRVAGSDLIPGLLQRAAERGWSIFLLGGSADVAAEAAQRIAAAYPTIRKVEHYSPPFRPLKDMNNAEIIKRVRSAKPDIVLVCFGCPKQEKWISQNLKELAAPVMIGAGATIDFLADKMARAPVWMQRSGTEWLFRLLQEPRRLTKRYADDFLHFFPAILLQRWRQRPPGPKRSWKARK